MPRHRLAFVALLLACCISSCRRHPTTILPAFYYWKSSDYALAPEEHSILHHIHARRLYIKFFEVEARPPLGPVPAAKTRLEYQPYPYDSLRYDAEIVPVVFINNSALSGLSANGTDSLAANILFLTAKYCGHMRPENKAWRELQLDCDWTAANKDVYFRLLRALKQRSGKVISCTLRLYPYKYRDKMGVPPADRAMLMCYNLLNPLTAGNENSILSAAQLRGYLGRRSTYPLLLDIGLPVYDRMQWYQHDRFAGVLHEDEAKLLPLLKPLRPYWYEVQQDTTIADGYLRAGDKIKYEAVSPALLRETAAILQAAVPLGDTATVAFFHLDSKILQHFDYATLDSVSASFGR